MFYLQSSSKCKVISHTIQELDSNDWMLCKIFCVPEKCAKRLKGKLTPVCNPHFLQNSSTFFQFAAKYVQSSSSSLCCTCCLNNTHTQTKIVSDRCFSSIKHKQWNKIVESEQTIQKSQCTFLKKVHYAGSYSFQRVIWSLQTHERNDFLNNF